MTTNADIARRRLANQRLVGTQFRSPIDAVGRLGAVQAQDYSGAKWAIAQRTRNATDAGIERLLASGAILRTHVLRPTWHFVLPADVRWMLALTGPRIAAQMRYYNPRLGLTSKVLARTNDVLARALEGETQLSRSEIAGALHRAGIDATDGIRVGRILMQAELDAVICSGARRGKQITYALLDDRAPPTKTIERDEALAALATRYFSTRSPATPRDFAWWCGLTVADAKRGVAAAGVRDLKKPTEPTRGVHLLPNYDEFFIAYRDRRAILDRVEGVVRLQGSAAVFGHVIEIDGQLVGGWRRVVTPQSVEVQTTYFAKINAAERKAVETQIERYKAFVGNSTDG